MRQEAFTVAAGAAMGPLVVATSITQDPAVQGALTALFGALAALLVELGKYLIAQVGKNDRK